MVPQRDQGRPHPARRDPEHRLLGFHEDRTKLDNAFEFEGCLGPGTGSRTGGPFNDC
jgi:hypothetical protein